MQRNNQYFGSPRHIKEYNIIVYAGIIMLITGGILFLFKEIYRIIAIVLLFIGLLCVVAGYLGLAEEKKKFGIKRKSTTSGIFALIFGVISVFTSNRPYLPIILGIIAIIFSIKAVKNGDNEYGIAGGISGLIGIIISLYVSILFLFF